jgi:hypothetical protein
MLIENVVSHLLRDSMHKIASSLLIHFGRVRIQANKQLVDNTKYLTKSKPFRFT